MQQMFVVLAFSVLSAVCAAALTWLAMRGKAIAAQFAIKEQAAKEISSLQSKIAILEQSNQVYKASSESHRQSQNGLHQAQLKLATLNATLDEQNLQRDQLILQKNQLNQKVEELLKERHQLAQQVSELSATLDVQTKQNIEKLALLAEAKVQLSDQFKSLANDILEEKSQRFSEQNQQSIGRMIEPLKVQIADFKGKIEEVYVSDVKERSALATELKQIIQLNQQLSSDANNLTQALKGGNKAQGNWGEFILETILEKIGFQQGHQYDVQESHQREDGSRVQPDVVIHMTQDKHLVVDSKVSLIAYNDYVSAENDAVRGQALRRHLDSCKAHVRGLSSKNYQDLYGAKSPDFVLMFMPIESAFLLAVTQDSHIWEDAWSKNILLVSPSTLLFVLRTVDHLRRQEQQYKNAQEIAKAGASLYDKIVGFVTDMEKLGKSIRQASDHYDTAFNKLSKGRGNALRQAEMLKSLGVQPSKQLPTDQIDDLELIDEIVKP